MSKALPVAAVLAALAALAWAAGLRNDVAELRERLARLEARPKRAPAPDAAAVEELRAELARVDAKVERGASTSKAANGESPVASLPEEEIRRVVDARLEEKKAAATTSSGGGEDRKMPLHDMAKELQLDPETQRRVGEIANAAKKEIFDVLRTPRPDGGDMAGEFIQVFLGDAEKIQPLFQRLLVEKVPGSERTYLLAVAGVQERARERLKGTMGEAVYTRYAHMSVNPENIETGWDPWGDYIKEKGLTPPPK